jgi:hypothetical protein
MADTEALIGRVLDALPALRSQYETTVAECVAEGLAEAGPAEFLYGYTHTLVEGYRRDPLAGQAPLAELAHILESEYGRDPDLDSFIRSTFLVLITTRPGLPDPARLLGPKLATAVQQDRNWRQSPENRAFVDRIITTVPALEPLARESTFGDHEDVLVHLFLADVVRQEVDNFLAGQLDEVRTVLDLIEREWGGDVDEPIAVSFVENLPYPHEPAAALVDLLGPNLRAEHDRQRHPPAPPP